MNKSIVIAVLISAVFCLAQEKQANPTVFTLEDVQVMASYYNKASIPARADSLTLVALQTLRAKLNFALAAKSTKGFVLTEQENSLVIFMLGNDIADAMRVLSLSNKLRPAPAMALKSLPKDTSKVLAKK